MRNLEGQFKMNNPRDGESIHEGIGSIDSVRFKGRHKNSIEKEERSGSETESIDSVVEDSVLDFKNSINNELEGKTEDEKENFILEKLKFLINDLEEGLSELKSNNEFYKEVFSGGYNLDQGDSPDTSKVVKAMRNTFRVSEAKINLLKELRDSFENKDNELGENAEEVFEKENNELGENAEEVFNEKYNKKEAA